MQSDISINELVLSKAVDRTIRPLVEKGVLGDAKAEGFHHKKMLPTAQPCLTPEALRQDPIANAARAVAAGTWLLSQYETMFAKTFFDRCDPAECGQHFLNLLHGEQDLESRIRAFLEWAPVRVSEDTGKKAGFNATVVSYLLAVVDPQQHAFCKPSVYAEAAKALLGAYESDPVKRILHANAFYRAALPLFRDKYGLPFTDLLHVHIAFFMMHDYEDYPDWKALDGANPPDPGNLGRLVLSRKNVVLYGPPGTGKTHQALDLASKWKAVHGEDSVYQVTFHPSYAYEDFIEGYRPNKEGRFELRDGLLVQVCDKARAEPARQFLLLIDEINRGDVARILGELITLIEADKRHDSVATRLPYSQKPFWVPPNVHLLGTMNTADRSISLLDIAIRRRFCFVECRPDPEVFAGSQKHLREVNGIPLSELLVCLNARLLAANIARDRAIGHSYFMIPADTSDPLAVLRERLRYDVLPLIEEYCYADRSLIRKILGDLVDEEGEVNDDLLDDDQRFTKLLHDLSEASHDSAKG